MLKNKTINPVNRIVIGDVGSGKTIVALLICLSYLKGLEAKYSSASFLAPTEILAFQHFQTMVDLKNKSPKLFDWIEIIYLSGKNCYLNDQKTTRKKLLESLNDNPKSKLWIGTQALLHNQDLQVSLVLVDEQHRFGVYQRGQISQKETPFLPHYLSFSATPIPRTLALTFFKYLKPHFLEKLQSRKDIQTEIISFDHLNQKILPAIKEKIQKNQKVYLICAKIEDKEEVEELEIWSIKKATDFLEKEFPGKVLSVHGKQKEKVEILKQFRDDSEKSILVATSVIEVGVDVATASLIIILNSERFGLAALHQLRGRIGRNDFSDNLCFLVTHGQFQYIKRLKYLARLNNGFEIAEKDLELRGSGDLFGNLQSGFGDEITELLGLNPEAYESINQTVENLDFENLETDLPRLKNYLKIKAETVWKE